jgi:hypothetical protein
MKIATKKSKERDPDDSLFGLLTAYKANSTYVRVLLNEETKKIVFQMTDNPRFFPAAESAEWKEYRQVKRSEMNVNRLFIKYLFPEHIIDFAGPNLGLKLTPRTGKILNSLTDKANRYFQLEMPQRMLPTLVLSIRKLVSLTPQKKYEIIEKYLANTAKPEAQD